MPVTWYSCLSKQVHSLQCTDAGGMHIVGVIYPGGNPNINF